MSEARQPFQLATNETKRETNKVAQLAPVSVGGRGHEGGVRAAAREIGIDRDDARRAKKVASLTPEAKKNGSSNLEANDNSINR